MKRALVSGITGQDGSYLAELLLQKGYEVHGLKRRTSSFGTSRVDAIYRDFHEKDACLFLYFADLTDSVTLWKLLYEIQPDEIYHLASQSHVRVSFDMPEYTSDVTALGTLRLLEAIRGTGIKTRFFHASSSEMFGAALPPHSEQSPFLPCSPHACAKVFAHQMTANYRQAFNLFACSGILFNHESPRRGETFVTRKVARAVARIKFGLEPKLYLGSLDPQRDWGYAPEYVEAMWLMLQQDEPEDYVIGTGVTHSVREFVELAFRHANLDWRDFVEIDARYYRPTEAPTLQADPYKARRKLRWQHKVTFDELVRVMVDAELAEVERTLSAPEIITPNPAAAVALSKRRSTRSTAA